MLSFVVVVAMLLRLRANCQTPWRLHRFRCGHQALSMFSSRLIHNSSYLGFDVLSSAVCNMFTCPAHSSRLLYVAWWPAVVDCCTAVLIGSALAAIFFDEIFCSGRSVACNDIARFNLQKVCFQSVAVVLWEVRYLSRYDCCFVDKVHISLNSYQYSCSFQMRVRLTWRT